MRKDKATEKVTEWDLTETEKTEMLELNMQRRGLGVMSEAQLHLATNIARAEYEWWDMVLKRLGFDRASGPYFLGDKRSTIKIAPKKQ